MKSNKYHTLGTFTKYNGKITPKTYIYMTAHFPGFAQTL